MDQAQKESGAADQGPSTPVRGSTPTPVVATPATNVAKIHRIDFSAPSRSKSEDVGNGAPNHLIGGSPASGDQHMKQ
jgi:hypothetical protein